jgi:subtilisin family serine protease
MSRARVTSRRHLSRAARTRSLAGTVVLALTVLSVPVATASPAVADPAQWWYDTYDVEQVHADGWTGEGVKVAVVGSLINPDLPVFADQDLTVADPLCTDFPQVASPDLVFENLHDSTVTAYVNGNGSGGGAIRGMAPGAEVTFYGDGRTQADGFCEVAEHPDQLSHYGLAVQRAIDDGARIITTSTAQGVTAGDVEVVANAIAKGVVLIAATVNAGGDAGGPEYPAAYNGVVEASAVDSAGALQPTQTGEPFAVAGTTVVAAGVDLPTVGATDQGWDASMTVTGSSLAAPLVAGMLAVVAQKYPEATGNQLIQSLIRNTGVEDHELERDQTGGYGYGAAWLTHMLQQDPAQYPDENPLMDKSGGAPDAAQVEAAAARGSVLPASGGPQPGSFDEYEETAPDSAPEEAAGGVIPAVVITGAVVLGVAVIGGAVVAVIVMNARKRKTSQEGHA